MTGGVGDIHPTNNTALKCDLRQDPAIVARLEKSGEQPVSYDEGLALARKLKASRYLGESCLSAGD